MKKSNIEKGIIQDSKIKKESPRAVTEKVNKIKSYLKIIIKYEPQVEMESYGKE